MTMPEELASELLSNCGRHCCICRRFRPVHLQVHHIVPQSEGGTDDSDNLIALCLTCHSDVHTKRPFTRRFTHSELKLHRNKVIQLVADGSLVPSEETIVEVSQILETVREHSFGDLSGLAGEILVAAVEAEGTIILSLHMGGATFVAGKAGKKIQPGREMAQYKAAIQELEINDFVDEAGWEGCIWNVTHIGYLTADELMAATVES